MIRSLLSHFVSTPPGGSAEVALSHEGIGLGWALLLVVMLGAAAFWAYHWAAPHLSRGRRGLLAVLRTVLIALFVLLLVKPVLMITLNDPVRERLLVLVDTTQSMQIKDRRRTDDDEKRAGLAAGLLPPATGLTPGVPSGIDQWRDSSRADLLNALAANDAMKLWPRLQEKADVVFYSLAQEAHPLGPINAAADPGSSVSTDDAKAFFSRLKFDGNSTAIGDSLQQVLDENRGQAVTGILLVTDGANNSGAAPEEIAQMAKQDGVPLYLYGIGITEPKDIIVEEINGPRAAFVKERAEFAVKVRAPGFNGQTVQLKLKADGKVVDQKDITLSDAETEYKVGYEPQDKGEAQIEATIDPLDEESASNNNTVSAKVRVLDSKVKVLYIEGEPRWDFRYLLSTLQKDRRLAVKCYLFETDPDLGSEPDSPFLKDFPATRADLISNEIIILGDVDPQELGEARMKLLNEWVSEMGGGIIFLAGPKFNPIHYAGTPLEPLLPVDLATGINDQQWGEHSRVPVPLKLTPAGELSTLLKLSDKPLENRQIWNSFPGVMWTAHVSRARPTAQVFLVDSRPEMANRDDLMPVIAQQAYGQGMVMYFGFDETYKWRSDVGEKYYLRIWNQIIQSFSLERQLGASARTQLKVEKPEYFTGDKVMISGKIFTENFAPLVEASVPGTMTFTGTSGKEEKSDVRLLAMADQPGQYEVEFTPKAAGEYHFSTIMDPKAVVKFDVSEPKLELGETAMNASLLKNMAEISGGKFLREEDLDGLPNLVASHSATIPSFKKVELYYSAWWMLALMLIAALEWFLRRLWQLK